MIRKDEKLSETRVDIANIGYEIDDNNLVRELEPIHRKMAMEKKPFTLIKKAQIRSMCFI